MGVSRGRAPAAGFFRTAEDARAARGPAGAGEVAFLLLLPSADASGFARRGGWERPNRSSVLGWWRADPKSLLLAPARGPGPESQANINLRKTLPLAGRRPSRFRASAELSTVRAGPRAANRRSSDHGHAPASYRGLRRRAGGPRSLLMLSPPKSPVLLVALLPRLRSRRGGDIFSRIRNPHIRPEL